MTQLEHISSAISEAETVEGDSLFCIYDVKARLYSAPVPFRNEEIAIRNFGTLINAPEGVHHDSPEDFVLVRVGSWDADNGGLQGELSPVHIVNGLNVRKELD